MPYEPKPGSFALFRNDKGENPKRPDYRGDGKDLDGNPIEISAWIKEGRNGKFMSCTMKPKGERRQSRNDDRTPDLDDGGSIPF